MSVLFIDCETTGLNPRVHVPWEVAIVEPGGDEYVWCWRPSAAALEKADAGALEIGGFDRAPSASHPAWERSCAQAVRRMTHGNVLAGSNPSFDMAMLEAWLRRFSFKPSWHYRPVCVATMAYGWLHKEFQEEAAEARDGDPWVAARAESLADLPWRSDDLSRACGVEPPSEDERHTALGDARWVARWYRALTGGES